MNALSLEVISNSILRATIRDIMERVYGIAPTRVRSLSRRE